MKKSRKIDSFFKRKERNKEIDSLSESQRVLENPRNEQNVNKICPDDIENSLKRDPKKRPPM